MCVGGRERGEGCVGGREEGGLGRLDEGERLDGGERGMDISEGKGWGKERNGGEKEENSGKVRSWKGEKGGS